MKVTVCIGSSCHLKGSRQIVEQLQSLIAQKGLQDSVELCGAFNSQDLNQIIRDAQVSIPIGAVTYTPEELLKIRAE